MSGRCWQKAGLPICRWERLIWLVCLIVMIYAVAGGLEAAFLTDMLQGMFIILLSVILIPFAWAKINVGHGGSGMMDALRTIRNRKKRACVLRRAR